MKFKEAVRAAECDEDEACRDERPKEGGEAGVDAAEEQASFSR
jgi:hypothetical protein